MAAPLIITENNGLKRTIALQGRSLPYKGAVLVEDEQRVEITFFPGNPVAYAQILGPQLTRTVFNGTWKDKYLQLAENAPRVLNFPTVSAAGQPLQPGSNLITGATFTSAGAFPGTQDLRLAKTVRDAFRLLCRSGAHMRVEWMDWVRFGYMTRFKCWPGPEDEWEWECEFAWTGDTDKQPTAQLVELDNKSFLDSLVNLLNSLNDLLSLPSQITATYLQPLLGKFADLLNQLTRLVSSLQGFVSFKFLPLTQLAAIKAACYALRAQVLDLLAELQGKDSRLGGASRRNTAETWYTELIIRKVRRILELIGEETAERLRQIEAATAGQVDRVYRVDSLTSLRHVSREVYGTQENWRDIAAFNGLATQVVEAGTVLKIPKL